MDIKNLKPTDKAIIISVICLATLTLVYFLIINPFETLKVLSLILFLGYMVFLLAHMFLLVPFFMITFSIIAATNMVPVFHKIKNKSEILFGIIAFFFCITSYFLVYVGVPFLLAFMYNGSLDINEAIITLKEFL